MNSYNEFFERLQGEFLNSLKQAQEFNVKSIAAMTDLAAKMPAVDAKEAASMQLPTATELVERTFAFTNQLIETRKEYMVKLAELATEAQQTFTETAKRVAESAKN